ncbi:MAG: hypothetical protein A2X46_04430 [Lentisphaerae bacterium GWF2_57_35]|nr:MAG: hypothetical protein A2X46_04430 [Lentisphaerae bacterium GWF2_57_35]
MALSAALSLMGCNENQPDPMVDRLHQQDQRIARLEARLSETESLRRTEQRALAEKLEAQAAEGRHATDQLTIQLSEVNRTLDELENSANKLAAALQVLKQTPRAPENVYTPPPIESDFVEEPAGRNADRFPVALENIVGEEIVTGAHISTRMAPTDKFERDGMGNKTRVMEQEEFEVNEYGYQVRFDVRNLTRTPKEIEVSAGPASRRFTIPAEGVLTNAAVSSVMGAKLSVNIGSLSRSYPVEYDRKPLKSRE